MKRNTAETRRRLLAFLGAIPVSFCSDPSKAEPKKLELSSYFHGEILPVNGAQIFADKATEDSAGTIRISLQAVPPWVPFQTMSKASALAHYCVPDVANIEPIFGLSALPMLTATFDEAETLLRIARPYYSSALARHGQILLATQPWRPVALWSTFRIRSIAQKRFTAVGRLVAKWSHTRWSDSPHVRSSGAASSSPTTTPKAAATPMAGAPRTCNCFIACQTESRLRQVRITVSAGNLV